MTLNPGLLWSYLGKHSLKNTFHCLIIKHVNDIINMHILSHSGSKFVIEGENLDSAHKTMVQYISKNPTPRFPPQVIYLFNFMLVQDLQKLVFM